MSEKKKSQPIQAFLRPRALSANAMARMEWKRSASQRVNGWDIVTIEQHRVSALKGDDMVHFAPAGSDFDNPQVLSEAEHAVALKEAVKWCKIHTRIVSRENVIACLREQIIKARRTINALRKKALESKGLSEKVLAHDRLKAEEGRLSNQRRFIFVAEDAIDASIRAATTAPFGEMAGLFPDAHALLERLIADQNGADAIAPEKSAVFISE